MTVTSGNSEICYTSIHTSGKFALFSAEDPYYFMTFESDAEYFALIQRLIEDGNKHFGRRSRLCDGVPVAGCIRDDYSDGEHASEFAKDVGASDD